MQSIRNVVDIDYIKYTIEEYSNALELANAILNDKYPVIVAEKQPESIIHAMVAYGISEIENNKFVKCKNSYGQDSTQPGNFHQSFKNHRKSYDKTNRIMKFKKDILEIPLNGTASSDGWSLVQPLEAIYILLTD